MITIDQYSLAALPIEMHFNDTHLSQGTGFVWSGPDRSFLITNWHNVSGRNPNTGKHLSPTAAEPNRLRVWFNAKGEMGSKLGKFVALRTEAGEPNWFVHPQHGKNVDVVALPLTSFPDVEMYPINKMENTNLQLSVGMDVYVLGYPYGLGGAGFPVWKRGSFATEPEISPAVQLHMFIDTASRPGMSGSPVIRRSWSTHLLEGNSISMGAATGTRFVGVYSGRMAAADPLDAQLGVAWPASLVSEIVSGQKRDDL
ncbi:trypsin-like peptidase domain-containing protein [Bradyrhizobium archetypum]|uniref:Trypsin-like peptidase domain-containing protein n=1 Tax=Bradyrhizobium archetypum TaxID=2721160 RepID=A0A7Y4M3F3_9BRAD|nr:trypsin-like peptidase domain-containing protein [Bradyrhizobium archetypum]NOJ48421.1 trypsin-like peptidase domain-containing protein [Bradyrhizobium archetypum]